MKSANFVTEVTQEDLDEVEKALSYQRDKKHGRRINIPPNKVNQVYKLTRKKIKLVEYVGPTKTICKGCGVSFLFSGDDRGRHPDYHSIACKQKAYRERKKNI